MGIKDDLEKYQYLQQMQMQQMQPMQQGAPQGMSFPGGFPEMMSPVMGAPDQNDMQMQEQMMHQSQQQPPQQGYLGAQPQSFQPPESPILMGARGGLEAAKRSLELNESENQRALGRAMLAFIDSTRNAPYTGNRLSDKLGSISAGISPAVAAYDEERNRIQQMNHQLQLEQKKEALEAQKEAREQQWREHQMTMAEKELGLKEKEFNYKKGERSLADEELLEEGVTPISSFKTGGERQQVRKHIERYHKIGKSSRNVAESTDLIKNIYENNPALSQHWGVIMQAGLSGKPSLVKQSLNKWFVPKDVQRDGWLVAKTLNDLVTNRVEGSSARASVFLEKLYKDASANVLMPAEATIPIMDKLNKLALEDYEDAEKVVEYGRRGGFYQPSLHKIDQIGDNKKQNTATTGMSEDVTENPADAYSPEQLLEMRKRITGG